MVVCCSALLFLVSLGFAFLGRLFQFGFGAVFSLAGASGAGEDNFVLIQFRRSVCGKHSLAIKKAFASDMLLSGR